jgi:hypothetical protein
VVGQGPLQNLTDLMLLRGIEMTILQVDVLDYALVAASSHTWLHVLSRSTNRETITRQPPLISSREGCGAREVSANMRKRRY